MALNFNSLISDLSLNNQNSINRENDKNDTCKYLKRSKNPIVHKSDSLKSVDPIVVLCI